MIGISPKEIIAQFVDVGTNFLREKRGLHGVGRDGGDRSFDEGGPASHRKIFGLPSFNTLTNSIHQILIGAYNATGGKNRSSEIGSDVVCGGKSKDSRHLLFYMPRGAGKEPNSQFGNTNKLAERLTKI